MSEKEKKEKIKKEVKAEKTKESAGEKKEIESPVGDLKYVLGPSSGSINFSGTQVRTKKQKKINTDNSAKNSADNSKAGADENENQVLKEKEGGNE